jgi:hypothetical protein
MNDVKNTKNSRCRIEEQNPGIFYHIYENSLRSYVASFIRDTYSEGMPPTKAKPYTATHTIPLVCEQRAIVALAANRF